MLVCFLFLFFVSLFLYFFLSLYSFCRSLFHSFFFSFFLSCFLAFFLSFFLSVFLFFFSFFLSVLLSFFLSFFVSFLVSVRLAHYRYSSIERAGQVALGSRVSTTRPVVGYRQTGWGGGHAPSPPPTQGARHWCSPRGLWCVVRCERCEWARGAIRRVGRALHTTAHARRGGLSPLLRRGGLRSVIRYTGANHTQCSLHDAWDSRQR
jgi:hypothetical protein